MISVTNVFLSFLWRLWRTSSCERLQQSVSLFLSVHLHYYVDDKELPDLG
jgi:hypothetical protein